MARGFKVYLSGQRAYLPDPCGPSTSAAEELNCRVRDGNGCFLLAMATRIEIIGRQAIGTDALGFDSQRSALVLNASGAEAL